MASSIVVRHNENDRDVRIRVMQANLQLQPSHPRQANIQNQAADS
jgi:hypothetical protein